MAIEKELLDQLLEGRDPETDSAVGAGIGPRGENLADRVGRHSNRGQQRAGVREDFSEAWIGISCAVEIGLGVEGIDCGDGIEHLVSPVDGV